MVLVTGPKSLVGAASRISEVPGDANSSTLEVPPLFFFFITLWASLTVGRFVALVRLGLVAPETVVAVEDDPGYCCLVVPGCLFGVVEVDDELCSPGVG
jgi:hypothetical protein